MRVVRPLLFTLSAAATHAIHQSEPPATCPEGQCEPAGDEGSLLQLHGKTAVVTEPDSDDLHKGDKRSLPFLGGRGGTLEGKIGINEDGKMNYYYLPGATTINNYTSVKYTPPYRFYLMKEYMDPPDYSKSEYFYKPLLVGKTFSVDIDVSAAGCGCNVNFYMVDMPAATPGAEGDYYCDAQCFAGKGCCAEWDMNEGNSKVQQITNHACTADYPGHPDWQCNKWGDPEVKTTNSQFGDAGASTIDTKQPFTFAQRYDLENGNLIVTTTISQGDKSVVLPMGPSSQLDAMYTAGSLEKGMVFVTGYWYASDMNWLDGQACGSGPESCSKAPAYISNWKITTNSGPAPGPAPSPTSGTCCWESCNGPCEMGDWCSAAENQCVTCGGGVWCNK